MSKINLKRKEISANSIPHYITAKHHWRYFKLWNLVKTQERYPLHKLKSYSNNEDQENFSHDSNRQQVSCHFLQKDEEDSCNIPATHMPISPYLSNRKKGLKHYITTSYKQHEKYIQEKLIKNLIKDFSSFFSSIHSLLFTEVLTEK